MVAYATHTLYDGKWKVTIWRGYSPEQEAPPDCPDLRNLIAQNYSVRPIDLAGIIMDSVLHCQRVHIELLSGEGIYAEKLGANYATEQEGS